MMCFKKIIAILICVFFVGITSVEACRFWVSIGEEIPNELISNRLISAPYSIKNLGEEYSDGWSVGTFKDNKPYVIRSDKPSHLDEAFSSSVAKIVENKSNIVFSHLRRASSGCVAGVENPHPFIIEREGKTWVFAHNGGIKKDLLVSLITNEYLESHPPKSCTYDVPDSWVDSELYFIYLIKKIEENQWDVMRGLKDALVELYLNIEIDNRYLNFFLSDGNKVWSFRRGTSLYFKVYENNQTVISSSIPMEGESGWSIFPTDTIIQFSTNNLPVKAPLFDKVIVNKY